MYTRSPELRYRLRYTPAADVALELGGVRSGNWYRCRCPGHGSQSLTLALCDGRDGLVIHCHAGCSRAKVAKALDDLGLLAPSAHQARPEPIDPTEHQRRSIQHAARLWHHSLPVGDGDCISTYWRSRGLGRLPIPRTIRRSVGLLPDEAGDLWFVTAMIALVEHVDRGAVAVHRTFLDDSGLRKASIRTPRKALGPISGGAVRLAAATEDVPLVIAEGIETAASASLLFGFPAWAALSTSGIRNLILPPMPLAKRVVIAADHDVNGAGENAATRAAERWIDEGRRVWIKTPPLPGTDWNDVLLGSRHCLEVAA